jgi:hypothetical protein
MTNALRLAWNNTRLVLLDDIHLATSFCSDSCFVCPSSVSSISIILWRGLRVATSCGRLNFGPPDHVVNKRT